MAKKNGNNKKFAKLKKAHKKMIGTCLVLMPFKEPFDTYFISIIKPAVHAAKLNCFRGDSLFRPSPIMAGVWQMIQDSKVLIADLTEKNANVFYELGLAHAIGKPVVLIADNVSDIPFDLQPLRVIIYNKNDPAWGSELKVSITQFLTETIGDTASAVPSMFRKIVKSQAPTETRTEARLDELEKRIATISSRGGRFAGVISTASELYHELKRAQSRMEALEITKSALRGGNLSMKLVSNVLSDAISPDESKAVLRELKLSKRNNF